MFQSVRPNSKIYVLHKTDKPYGEIGSVTTQPIIRPKYAIPTKFGQPQEMVVDIAVKIGEQTFNYNNLPAQQDIADTFVNNESIVVADSKEAINAELLNSVQKSTDIINSKPFHEGLVESYNKIYSDWNPEFAEKEAQKEEIESLKVQMVDMSRNLKELMDTNRLLIERLSSKGI